MLSTSVDLICETRWPIRVVIPLPELCRTHIGRAERQTQQSVNQEGEDCGEGGDDAGDAGVYVLDVTEPLHLFHFSFS